MKVETLLERMSGENVNKLHNYCAHYPNVGKALMNELSTICYWTQLTYESVANLNDVFGMGYRPENVGNLFSKY
jgi:hypothetical protein